MAASTIQPSAVERVASSTVADELLLADVLLVAVVFDRDLHVRIGEVDAGDKLPVFVEDGELCQWSR